MCIRDRSDDGIFFFRPDPTRPVCSFGQTKKVYDTSILIIPDTFIEILKQQAYLRFMIVDEMTNFFKKVDGRSYTVWENMIFLKYYVKTEGTKN